MRIGVDVTGGDKGADVVINGAVEACAALNEDDRIVLVGDRESTEKILENTDCDKSRLEIQHAQDVIEMGESPVEALRKKPQSSIVIMTELQRQGHLDACVSAGNTGACVAAAHMMLGTLEGVQRPGIAITSPALGYPFSLCDVGANVNCRPQHLYQYAVMTSLYATTLFDVESPRVALLSVGEEDGKGNDLVKSTRKLLKQDDKLNFIGNMESRDILRGNCDVVICDGFTGNITLKLMEGFGEDLMTLLAEKVAHYMPEQTDVFKKAVNDISTIYDFNKYGGAPLLGVNGIWMICHGASASSGIANAIKAATVFSMHNLNLRITERLSEDTKE